MRTFFINQISLSAFAPAPRFTSSFGRGLLVLGRSLAKEVKDRKEVMEVREVKKVRARVRQGACTRARAHERVNDSIKPGGQELA